MNEEEALEIFKNLILLPYDWKITDKYKGTINFIGAVEGNEAIEIISNLIEKLQKENEELKKSKITYEKVRDIQEKNKNIVDKKYISKQKVREKIEEMQKEYNKLDEEVDKYINDANKDSTKFYKNRERISTMQALSYFINTLKELIEGRK